MLMDVDDVSKIAQQLASGPVELLVGSDIPAFTTTEFASGQLLASQPADTLFKPFDGGRR